MRIEFSSFVKSDLESIGDYIALDNPRRALSFIREIRFAILALARNPQQHRLRPEIGSEVRLAVFGRYVILYRIRETTVRIERVVFGGRDLQHLLK